MPAIDIERNAGKQRFETVVDNQLCVLEYVLDGNTISINHVRVPEAIGGRGIAGELTRQALDWAREENLRVVPNCPYVARWIDRHPEYQGLV